MGLSSNTFSLYTLAKLPFLPKFRCNTGLAFSNAPLIATRWRQGSDSGPSDTGLRKASMCLAARTNNVRSGETTKDRIEVPFNEVPLGVLRGRAGPILPTIAVASGNPKPKCITDNDLRPNVLRSSKFKATFFEEPFNTLLKNAILTLRSKRLALRGRKNGLAKPLIWVFRKAFIFVGSSRFRQHQDQLHPFWLFPISFQIQRRITGLEIPAQSTVYREPTQLCIRCHGQDYVPETASVRHRFFSPSLCKKSMAGAGYVARNASATDASSTNYSDSHRPTSAKSQTECSILHYTRFPPKRSAPRPRPSQSTEL